MSDLRGTVVGAVLLAIFFTFAPTPCLLAGTLEEALIQAYQDNPQLNAQRTFVRATDENIPQALSGYRPRISITNSAGAQYVDLTQPAGFLPNGDRAYLRTFDTQQPRNVAVTLSQSLLNGNQTANRTRATESQASSAREGLRVIEQNVLLAAATAYVDVLRDTAVTFVQRNNVKSLTESLSQTRDRARVGDVTATDVAQSEAQLAAGRTQLLTAESNFTTTKSNYRRVIGKEPETLRPASPVDRLLPRTLKSALILGNEQNPNITAAMFGIDLQFLITKINEGALFPSVTLQAGGELALDSSVGTQKFSTVSALAQVNAPIYQGGAEYSLIRQSKESLAQQQLTLVQTRDQVRVEVNQTWGLLQAAKGQIVSAQAQVDAAERALDGVQEEAKLGQRTTLDVLNAQQALVNSRVSIVIAQHDRIVASYATLSAVGQLSAQNLKLATNIYDPRVHAAQIRDAWAGVRTPDGR